MTSLSFRRGRAFCVAVPVAGVACLTALLTELRPALAADPPALAAHPAPNLPDAPTARGAALQLSAFVRAVLAINPSLAAAKQGSRAALGRVRQAGALEDPMLAIDLAPLSLGANDAAFGYAVSIRQKLPWFGKRGLDTEIRAAEARATEYDSDTLARELGLTAASLYVHYFVVARSTEINAAHLVLVQTLREAAAAQFSSGHGSVEDELQAEAELTELEHDAVTLASDREVTVAQMNELLHRAPETPLPPPPDELPQPPKFDVKSDLATQGKRVTSQRPDILALEQRAAAARAQGERAERDAYPDFTLSTEYNSMWDLPQHRWMVGFEFNLPVFSARREGAIDEAHAARSQLELDAERARDAARTQVFVAAQRLSESKHLVGLFEARLLPLARRRIEAARAAFSASQSPFAALIEAERSSRRTDLEYQMTRAECVLRQAELEHALGRIAGLSEAAGAP